ncbi:hypothetical protein [Actinospongicola halichondriae]|uniref:hypothetical protein n=1 Tax=Actinospongicola halichondriae TaxID=3236844 RepID=UPI003D5764F8
MDQSAASCVAAFSAETLRARSFAFDGTVATVEEAQDPKAPEPETGMLRVTFEVNEWFAGGDGDTADVWVPRAVVVGDRLLVSGEPRWGGDLLDDAIAWTGCGGFTSAYSPDDADLWRSASSG